MSSPPSIAGSDSLTGTPKGAEVAPGSPLRLREAAVIALAIVGLGGTWMMLDHRREVARLEAEERLRTPPPVHVAPPPAPERRLRDLSDTELERATLVARAGRDSAQAIELLEEKLRRTPRDHETRLTLASLLLEAGEADRADAHLELLRSLDPAVDSQAERIRVLVRAFRR